MPRPARKTPSLRTAPLRDPKQVNPKGRISAKCRRAIELMIWEGSPRSKAAKDAGMSDRALHDALKRPHVLSLLRQEHDTLRSGGAIRAYSRQERLAEQAGSEDVQERANRWIAGCDGLAPVTKVAIQAQVSHSFDGIGFAPRIIDVTPEAPPHVVSDAE